MTTLLLTDILYALGIPASCAYTKSSRLRKPRWCIDNDTTVVLLAGYTLQVRRQNRIEKPFRKACAAGGETTANLADRSLVRSPVLVRWRRFTPQQRYSCSKLLMATWVVVIADRFRTCRRRPASGGLLVAIAEILPGMP